MASTSKRGSHQTIGWYFERICTAIYRAELIVSCVLVFLVLERAQLSLCVCFVGLAGVCASKMFGIALWRHWRILADVINGVATSIILYYEFMYIHPPRIE